MNKHFNLHGNFWQNDHSWLDVFLENTAFNLPNIASVINETIYKWKSNSLVFILYQIWHAFISLPQTYTYVTYLNLCISIKYLDIKSHDVVHTTKVTPKSQFLRINIFTSTISFPIQAHRHSKLFEKSLLWKCHLI